MTDYVKLGTGTNLASTASWTPTGVPASTTADTATWNATSLGGTLSGNISTRKVTVNGATNNITHSGTLTLGVDGFEFGADNTRGWTVGGSTGVLAVGSDNQTWVMHAIGFSSVVLSGSSANVMTGTAEVTLEKLPGGTGPADMYVTRAAANFTGTFRLRAGASISAAGAAVLTACNFIIEGGALVSSIASATLGSAGKTITVTGDCRLGQLSYSLTLAPNVVLAGTGTQTLTVNGETSITGSVSSSDGITVAGDSKYVRLNLLGSSSLAGMSGPLAVLPGGFIEYTAQAWTPTAFDVAADGRVRLQIGSSNYTFARTPTGEGWIDVRGTAATGITFPAAPAEGNIADFAGSIGAQANAGESARVVISDLPGGLRLVATANAASPPILTQITYDGAGQTKATSVTVDSENNTSRTNLTAGTYALRSSGSGPVVLTGPVQRTNSTAGATPTASARMSLTLGGTNTGDNTLSGTISEVGTNGAILGITKTDAGRWVLSGTNTYTGQTDVSGGTLSAQSANALGGTAGTVIIRSGATLELNGGYTFDKRDADWEARSASGGIDSIGANTILCRNFALTESLTTFTVSTGNKLTIDPQLSGAVEGAITGVNLGIAKAGAGELELAANANTFSGAVTISAGTLTVGSVANGGAAAAWGQASSAVAVSGTLKYSGATGSSSRAVQMTGSAPTINASGSGALTLSNVTQDTTAKTMTLRGTSTAANTVSNAIANNTGAVSLAKEDAGKWVLTGALSYTGTTAVNGGTLRVETGNSNTTSGAVTIGASGTVELVTDTLASAGGTSGEVLGTGNVTVNGGTIKTRGGTTQKGQVRYGGNLTFGAGSTLYIGAAA